MGMPGSTEHLDELMTRVLGDLMQAGMVVKLADDLYTGGNSIDELLHNWELILQRFEANNLRLSAEKTEICPGTCTILGWIWSHGTISVSPHKVTPLKSASPPKTVKALRSWLGAYKHLKVCLSGHSMLLSDLEKATAGKASQAPVEWTPSLTTAFHDAQQALSSLKCITIPRPSDKLIITNDGAVKLGGIGAVLYIIRDSKMLLGGFFSAKLKTHQVKWLPCEIEALAIASSVNHWAPYIIENNHTVQLLTDSRPCVQAFTKLGRGEFSSSARVSSFLSSLSRHNVTLQYIPGDANAPADFQSRNPADCTNLACQICKFVRECEESTVLQITVTDVLNGTSRMPFMSPLTWKSSQQDCPTLRRTYAHLQQGTRPGRKATHVGNLKRYLQVCAIGRHGLLVVRRDRPFATSQDLTVIPSHILPGLLSALHLRLQHPTKSQLSKVFHRYFFALDAEIEIQRVTQTCDQCVALARLPKECEDFSTSELPAVLGTEFACDILRRAKQCIFIIRDSFSSYTVSKLIPDEKSTTLKAALIECTADLISPSGCCVRVDGASSFQSLVEDPYLTSRHIKLVVGRIKNRNKNPVGEKAVQELEYELKRCQPDGSPITASQLAVATAQLNLRVRGRGLSAKEIVYQRDAHTGEQLNFSDKALSETQHQQRLDSHLPSARSHARTDKGPNHATVSLGDLIYIKSDGDKHTAREKHIVTAIEEDYLFAQKLTGFQFRSKPYKLKFSEVLKIPSMHSNLLSQDYTRGESDEEPTPVKTPRQKVSDQLKQLPPSSHLQSVDEPEVSSS